MLRIDCDTLPEGAFQDVRAIVERRKRGRCPFEELRAARDRGGLPGLALLHIQEEGKQLTVPPPIDVWFEPTPLDEAREGFAALAYAEFIRSTAEGHPPEPSLGRRFCLRWVRPMFSLAFDLYWLLEAAGLLGPLGFALAALATPFLLIAKLLHWWESPTWLVIPGGVVVRHSAESGAESGFTRVTPEDTILRVSPVAFGWCVELVARKRYARVLTTLECNVLLAAWQSRRSPPSAQLLAEAMQGSEA